MIGYAKAILFTIIIATLFLVFTNVIYFFPWYMTLIYETFSLSTSVAQDNYLKEMYKSSTYDRLKKMPVYRENPVTIVCKDEAGVKHEGENDATTYYNEVLPEAKPYVKRGEQLIVEISTSYPLKIKLAGKDVGFDIPVSFQLKTTALREYKDKPSD